MGTTTDTPAHSAGLKDIHATAVSTDTSEIKTRLFGRARALYHYLNTLHERYLPKAPVDIGETIIRKALAQYTKRFKSLSGNPLTHEGIQATLSEQRSSDIALNDDAINKLFALIETQQTKQSLRPLTTQGILAAYNILNALLLETTAPYLSPSNDFQGMMNLPLTLSSNPRDSFCQKLHAVAKAQLPEVLKRHKSLQSIRKALKDLFDKMLGSVIPQWEDFKCPRDLTIDSVSSHDLFDIELCYRLVLAEMIKGQAVSDFLSADNLQKNIPHLQDPTPFAEKLRNILSPVSIDGASLQAIPRSEYGSVRGGASSTAFFRVAPGRKSAAEITFLSSETAALLKQYRDEPPAPLRAVAQRHCF